MPASLPLILTGFVVIWLGLDRSAFYLGSFVGEYGLLVCLITVLLALAVEAIINGRHPVAALRALGFGAPNLTGSLLAVGISLAMLAILAVNLWQGGAEVGLRESWPWLALGMFFQGGVAEEVLFRGYLFRHMRERWSFWRAAWTAAIPFVAVHLLLFVSMPVGIAAASIGLSLAISFPLAWIFERSGNSIWPPAILHAVTQAGIKLLIIPEAALPGIAFTWMVVTAILPWLAFFVRPEEQLPDDRTHRRYR
jgi:membrane protease YdiL (CAAX protease family)